MKLILVALAGIFAAFTTAFILAPAASSEESVLVFGRQFTVSNPVVESHEQGYLQRVGLTNLSIKRMDSDAASLALMTAHVLGEGNALESDLMASRSIQFLVLFSYQTKDDYGIELANTVGISFCYIQKGVPYLALYEQKEGKMVAIPQYHMRISGAPRLDDLRLLHFSFADSAESLPSSSEIYMVRNEARQTEIFDEIMGDDLRLQLITDSDRNAGRFASMFFMGPSYFGFKRGGVDLLIDDFVPRDLLFYLRDDVLMESKRGQEYIRGVYRFGGLLKKNPDLLVKYAALVPKLEQVVEILVNGNGLTTVLDQATAVEIHEIIDSHRDVLDSRFQEFLDLVEADAEALKGQTKNDFVAYLKQAQ